MRTTRLLIASLTLPALIAVATLPPSGVQAAESSTVKVKRKPTDAEWKEYPTSR